MVPNPFEVGPRDGLQAGGIEFANVLSSMEADIDVIDVAGGRLRAEPQRSSPTGAWCRG
jgi:hypothetical protein